MDKTENNALIEILNRMLAQEHACAIRYATHAAAITGPFSETVSERLKEIASDEIRHAAVLRERIHGLGGVPTMSVQTDDLLPGDTLREILEIDMTEERVAIGEYARILQAIPQLNAILYEAVEELLRDEQEHLEQLLRLRPLEGKENGNGDKRTQDRAGFGKEHQEKVLPSL